MPLLVRLQVCGQRMTVWALLMGGGFVLGLLHGAAPPRRNGRSDQLGHPQVCDCQFEVALVEHLCVCFLAARGFDPV